MRPQTENDWTPARLRLGIARAGRLRIPKASLSASTTSSGWFKLLFRVLVRSSPRPTRSNIVPVRLVISIEKSQTGFTDCETNRSSPGLPVPDNVIPRSLRLELELHRSRA